MIGQHLAQLRRVLDETDNLPESTKAELLRLVQAAEAETGAATNAEGGVTNAEEGAEEEVSVLDQLKQSIEELEASHPDAAAAVNRVATVLANMGI
ncbi:DUF4404 family protein [Phragmitibacter flavus]|uniref:DUF4404 family protein n=1 Tax=Phragmitibacter flavus TaxID=2576071 RepID=A0A5R8KL92_9BACT|nr:DUF4404 family protein [Phragmitibacter flavus]TLD72785.1 DUF4404 family protein [Phragmitibacter flavus]